MYMYVMSTYRVYTVDMYVHCTQTVDVYFVCVNISFYFLSFIIMYMKTTLKIDIDLI